MRANASGPVAFGVAAAADEQQIAAAVGAVAGVRISPEIIEYIVNIVRATRQSAALSIGASPRAASMMAAGSRAYAALDGRDYVVPDDVKRLMRPALRHRVILSPTAEIEGRSPDEALEDVIEQIEAPR